MRRHAAIACLIALIVAGCGRPSTPTSKLSIVASFYPLYHFAQEVGGDRVQVTNLVPAGSEPHDYELTPQDVANLTRAKVLIYNGAGFEPWVSKLLPQLPDTIVKVEASQGAPLVKEEGTVDPHIWLDPVLAEGQVDNILAGLVRADLDGKDAYGANARKLKEDLQVLHRRYAEALQKCSKKTFISSHEAFGYLAKRYGLEMIAISGLSPEAEPSPAKLKEVATLAKRHGVHVIYVETLVSPRMAETIAREVGAPVRVLDPLEGLSDASLAAGRNYFTVMDENLRNLLEGFDCR